MSSATLVAPEPVQTVFSASAELEDITLTPPALTTQPETRLKSKWLKLAKSKIAKAYKIRSVEKMYLVRNKLINRAYAEMYFSDPDTFKWSGLAVFASHSIGKKLELLQSVSRISLSTLLLSFGTALPMWLASSQLKYLHKVVAQGNLDIYMDIFWVHLAYREGGIEELEKIYQQGDLPLQVFRGWQKLDEGKKTQNQDLIWEANVDLLRHEQEDIIQPVLYDGKQNELLWETISITHGIFGTLVASPVPEETRSFRDCMPGANLAIFEDRWQWCTEDIMPRWRVYQTKYPQKVVAKIKSLIA